MHRIDRFLNLAVLEYSLQALKRRGKTHKMIRRETVVHHTDSSPFLVPKLLSTDVYLRLRNGNDS